MFISFYEIKHKLFICLSAIINIDFFTFINIDNNLYNLIGSRSSGLALEIEDIDDASRSDLGNSDNEDNTSMISQTMSSLLRKDGGGRNSKDKTSLMELGIISSTEKEIINSRNNNDATNRNLESMRNSLIDVEQRLKAQR